jgi:hypothetical protein
MGAENDDRLIEINTDWIRRICGSLQLAQGPFADIARIVFYLFTMGAGSKNLSKDVHNVKTFSFDKIG